MLNFIVWLFFILQFGLLVRNQLVYDYRIKLIHLDHEKYLLLPSYDEMMYKFWIWDFDKFLVEQEV